MRPVVSLGDSLARGADWVAQTIINHEENNISNSHARRLAEFPEGGGDLWRGGDEECEQLDYEFGGF